MSKGVAFDFYDQAKIEARRESAPAPAQKHEPLQFECDECGAPARFGEGVHLIRGIVGTWFCSRHAPLNLKRPGGA